MLDIAVASQGFKRKEISNIGFVRSNDNVSDVLTKSMKQAALMKVMETGRLDIHPEQWIIRR